MKRRGSNTILFLCFVVIYLFHVLVHSALSDEISWPIFRGDQRLTGVAKGRLPDRMKLLWTFKTDDEIKSSPVIYGLVVFIGSSDGKVYALSLHDGNKIWEYDTGSPVEAPPLLVYDTVFIGTLDGILYALDARKGEPKWTYETGNRIVGSAN
jgi:hypothetical protein